MPDGKLAMCYIFCGACIWVVCSKVLLQLGSAHPFALVSQAHGSLLPQSSEMGIIGPFYLEKMNCVILRTCYTCVTVCVSQSVNSVDHKARLWLYGLVEEFLYNL